MRLDKFLSVTGTASRSESAKASRRGEILVNGVAVRSTSIQIDPKADTVAYCGESVVYREFTYIMLNKPEGYVSATEDGKDKTVLDLLPEKLQRLNLFPCGRLDKNTLGLMLLTDNGELAHKLLAPKNHVSKTYRFRSGSPLSQDDVSALENGVEIRGGYVTKPAKLEYSFPDKEGSITITEGKYHQIKLMFEAVGNKIVYLERVVFGPLALDKGLERGEWRFLTESETEQLEKHCK